MRQPCEVMGEGDDGLHWMEVTQPVLAAALLALSLLSNTACAVAPAHQMRSSVFEQASLVDLTHPFGAETIVWPTEQDVRLIVQHAEDQPNGYYYASHRIEMPEHGGTHIDAPVHFVKGGQTLDAIPLERLTGAAVRIDVSESCAHDRDYLIGIQDLERWEASRGRIPEESIVLLDTGFAALWPSRARYLGTERRGAEAVRELHFPGLHPEAARWLVRERRVKAVGIDTASIDYGRSSRFEARVVLLSQSVPVFENLADLRALPARDFEIIALPMKIHGGTGGPLRIIAIIPAKS
jgi:kynurenine formamidase